MGGGRAENQIWHGKPIYASQHPGKPFEGFEIPKEARKEGKAACSSGHFESQSTEIAVRLRVESRKEQPEGARRGAGRERPESAPELRCNHGGAGGKGRNPRAPARAQGAGPACPTPGRL